MTITTTITTMTPPTISIAHSILREFQAVARKLDRRRHNRTVEIMSDRSGLMLQVASDDALLRHHSPGRRPDTRLLVPLQAFNELPSRTTGSVAFRASRRGQVEVSRQEDGTARTRCYPAPKPE